MIGTGQTYSVRDFLDEAFAYVNLDWHDYVQLDSRYFRPRGVHCLQSDASKAMRALDWQPRVFFRELVRIMVDANLELLGLTSPGEGRKILENLCGPWHRWEGQVASMGMNGNGQS